MGFTPEQIKGRMHHLRDQQLHTDPDGIGSQTVQCADIGTTAAIPQFLLCDLPEVVTGNHLIDLACRMENR